MSMSGGMSCTHPQCGRLPAGWEPWAAPPQSVTALLSFDDEDFILESESFYVSSAH